MLLPPTRTVSEAAVIKPPLCPAAKAGNQLEKLLKPVGNQLNGDQASSEPTSFKHVGLWANVIANDQLVPSIAF